MSIRPTTSRGGSWIGPEVAERLGRRFIDRAIPAQVAERLAVPVEHAQRHDEAAAPPFTRLLARLPNTSGVLVPEPTMEEFCRETERLLVEAANAGNVVVLGRAGAFVLRDRPDSLHVRLDGPEKARLAQTMRIQNIDQADARRRRRVADRAQIDYVKHFYRADPRDPRPYHIFLNSTELAPETCVEVIVTAASGR